jgi:hypothetical protein
MVQQPSTAYDWSSNSSGSFLSKLETSSGHAWRRVNSDASVNPSGTRAGPLPCRSYSRTRTHEYVEQNLKLVVGVSTLDWLKRTLGKSHVFEQSVCLIGIHVP